MLFRSMSPSTANSCSGIDRSLSKWEAPAFCQAIPILKPWVPRRSLQAATRSGSAVKNGPFWGTVSGVVPRMAGTLIIEAQRMSLDPARTAMSETTRSTPGTVRSWRPVRPLAVDFADRIETLGETFDAGGGAFLDTAAVMMNLDLIVTPCNSIAALAGALGRPTFVALMHVPEWRWLLNRDDSPWYPATRLFRQSSAGDWPGVFAHIAEAVRARASAAN